MLGDTAYGTGDARAALTDAGRTSVINPGPLSSPVAGGLTLDDFTVDETAGTATCPNGVTRRITAKRSVTVGVACRGCPLRQRCTTSTTGRTLSLHPTTHCCVKPAGTGARITGCERPTASTARWSNAPSLG